MQTGFLISLCIVSIVPARFTRTAAVEEGIVVSHYGCAEKSELRGRIEGERERQRDRIYPSPHADRHRRRMFRNSRGHNE